jgi:RND family efflux transporter MFP subunit
MKKWSLLYFIVLSTLANACVANNAEPVQKAVQVTATVELTPVVSKVIQQSLFAYGTILPDTDQLDTLSTPHAGMVEKVWVRPGQKIKKGDFLFSLNTAPGEKMTFLQAVASVTFAKKELSKQEQLLSEHLTTESTVISARKALKDAQINLASLQKRGLGENLQRFAAPNDGIVTQVNLQAGQRVQSDVSAIQIASDQQFIVRLGVEPADLGSLAVGQTVKIQSVFDDAKPFMSEVSQIHAMLNPTTQLVDVIAPIPLEESKHLVIGSRLTGEIQINPHLALVVPRNAILTDDKGSYVFVIKEGKAKRINVVTGQSTHEWVEVMHGLQEGENVISHGNYELSSGMKVQQEKK